MYNDDLPPYHPIHQQPIEPVSRSYKYKFNIPSAGIMTIHARNNGTLAFHHVPATTTGGISHGGIAGGLDNGNALAGTSETRQEKLDQTKLKLQEARAKFQESMDRLNQELTLVKDNDSVTLLNGGEVDSLTGDLETFKDNDCKGLVKI